ncbi:hypothetical protein PQX77_001260 [Marasmius sp. AFHP31]|nr:hypothetical protein PQX77_001260 [Marasmius sp. AFHP31]
MSTRGESGRRQSSRLKLQPVKALNENSDSEDEEKAKLTRKSQPKRLREEESFRVGNDIGSSAKRRRIKSAYRASGKLSLLPTMPLDVLYTVGDLHNYLPPKSLLSLTRVNHSFRTTLLSPTTTFIWTRTRKSCKAPDPWEGVGEVEWVRLLFGSTNCQSCGNKGVQRIEFLLMQRICFACVKANGISKRRFKQTYPDGDKIALDLVNPTDGGQRTGHTRYYSRKEIDRVLENVRNCKTPDELDVYVKERNAYLERLAGHARLCYEWMQNDYTRMAEDAQNATEERFNAIKSRLRDMGFVDEDIERIKYEDGVLEYKPLTDRVWARLRPKLTETLMNYRVQRLLSLYYTRNSNTSTVTTLAVVTSRCTLINQCYVAYKRTVSPSKWRDLPLPCTEAVFSLTSMKRIIGLPDDVEVTAQTVHEAVTDEEFTEELERAIRNIRKTLLGDYRVGGRQSAFWKWLGLDSKNTLSSAASGSKQTQPPEFNREDILLNLATVQSRCFTCGAVCSSAFTLMRHLTGPCYIRSGSVIFYSGTFDTFYSRTAAGLVWATFGKDRMYDATADEMDERGEWYQCLMCPSTNIVVEGEGEARSAGFVGTWRECITHAFEKTTLDAPGGYNWNPTHETLRDQGPDDPVYRILDRKEVEDMHLEDERKCWSCARCTVNTEELWTRERVITHLKDEHQVVDPRVPMDVFYAAWDEKPQVHEERTNRSMF